MDERLKARETLLAMAAWIEAHGFDPSYQASGNLNCGCFMHAFHRVYGGMDMTAESYVLMRSTLLNVINSGDVYEDDLLIAGWDSTATLDAAAACVIAADLVSP